MSIVAGFALTLLAVFVPILSFTVGLAADEAEGYHGMDGLYKALTVLFIAITLADIVVIY